VPVRRGSAGRHSAWAQHTATPDVRSEKEEVAVPKVLLLTRDAAESLEVMYPYQRLMEEGYQVDIAAPSAKKLQFVIHRLRRRVRHLYRETWLHVAG
jgi:hypothetical protein